MLVGIRNLWLVWSWVRSFVNVISYTTSDYRNLSEEEKVGIFYDRDENTSKLVHVHHLFALEQIWVLKNYGFIKTRVQMVILQTRLEKTWKKACKPLIIFQNMFVDFMSYTSYHIYQFLSKKLPGSNFDKKFTELKI